jgi:hypothetical protein
LIRDTKHADQRRVVEAGDESGESDESVHRVDGHDAAGVCGDESLHGRPLSSACRVLQLCAALALLNTLRFRFIPRAACEAGTAARQRTLQNSLCTMQSIDTGRRKNLMIAAAPYGPRYEGRHKGRYLNLDSERNQGAMN